MIMSNAINSLMVWKVYLYWRYEVSTESFEDVPCLAPIVDGALWTAEIYHQFNTYILFSSQGHGMLKAVPIEIGNTQQSWYRKNLQ